MLRAVGFSADDERIYRLMLEHPDADVAQLCELLDWPEERVRAALDSLARLSLLRPSKANPDQMRLVNPQVGLASLLNRGEADLAERQKEIIESRIAVAEMLSRYVDQNPPLNQLDAEQLVGIGEVRARIGELVRTCESEVMSFSPGGPQSPENMAQSRPLDAALLDRGVRIRTIYLDSVRNDLRTMEYASWLTANGGQVRTVPALPLRMIIMDRRVVIAAVSPEHSDVGAVALRAPGLVVAFCELFQAVWDKANPFGAPPNRGQHGLTPQERTVLELLSQGLTDEVVARRMGVSVRTGRRITADLMARLGARSRFQAGMLVAELGWLGNNRPVGADPGGEAGDSTAGAEGDPDGEG